MSQDQLRVLIVGNGGREHAFAWKLSQSPRVQIVYVAPGNGGTGLGSSSKIANANVKGDDYPGLVAFAQKNGVNLVVPGPEAPLVDGIQGYFQAGRWTAPISYIIFYPSRLVVSNPSFSRHQMLRSVQGGSPHGGLKDLFQRFYETP